MCSAAYWRFLAVFFCSLASANANRGDWLCGLVNDMQAQYPAYNVLGFRAGRIQAYDVVKVQNVTYPPGCSEREWLAFHALGRLSVPVARQHAFSHDKVQIAVPCVIALHMGVHMLNFT